MSIRPGTPARLTEPKTMNVHLPDGSVFTTVIPAGTVVEHEGPNGDDHAWCRGVVALEGEVVYQLHEVEPADQPDPLDDPDGEEEGR